MKKILIIRMSSIGDIVLSTSFIESVKNVVASTKKDSADKQIFKTSCKTGNGIEELANALIKSHSSINKNERQ
jgi:selenocysteine-specific translation elongation factor